MYTLLDSGRFQKLERVGPWRIVRPAAQAVWSPRLDESLWDQADAIFTRFSGGDGRWEIRSRKLPESWTIPIPHVGQMVIKLTDFGHLGIFPEQHQNWQRLHHIISQAKLEAPDRPLQVLNLFAYTGGSSLACALAGAHVTHLDASKTSVTWARDNAEASGLSQAPIRWIVDDVSKFIARELRRGTKYHGIILDPPSYGRGPKGETWKIEDMLSELLKNLKEILAEDFKFILLSSHSAGYTPLSLTNLVGDLWPLSGGSIAAEEMTVMEQPEQLDQEQLAQGRALPSGASCFFTKTST